MGIIVDRTYNIVILDQLRSYRVTALPYANSHFILQRSYIFKRSTHCQPFRFSFSRWLAEIYERLEKPFT